MHKLSRAEILAIAAFIVILIVWLIHTAINLRFPVKDFYSTETNLVVLIIYPDKSFDLKKNIKPGTTLYELFGGSKGGPVLKPGVPLRITEGNLQSGNQEESEIQIIVAPLKSKSGYK